jgi:hypothetical protein
MPKIFAPNQVKCAKLCLIKECDFHSTAKLLGSGKNLSNTRMVFREKLKNTRASLKKLID